MDRPTLLTRDELKQALTAQGWLPAPSVANASQESAVLVEYQTFHELEVTGELDSVTERHILLPRFCSYPDRMAVEELSGPARWGIRSLTWSLVGSIPGLSNEDAKAAFAEAWTGWTNAANLTATYTANAKTANIIKTVGGIDRSGGTLAWSELPNGNDGQLTQKYDAHERWIIAENPPSASIDLVRVARHELGHALGISHIGGNNLLAPTYSSRIRGLQAGDVAEIVKRYGARQAPPPTPGIPPTVPPTQTKGGVWVFIPEGQWKAAA